MRSFREIEKPEYGICLVTCECQVFNTSRSLKTYIVVKRGSLVKFLYRISKNGSVRTLVINKIEVYMQNSLHYFTIEFKLFKYLNAINDFEERVQFYTDYERREFVLRLERNSDVSVGFSSGKQSKAVFQEINENEEKIFIIVELLERPFKYSLPANMVHTIAIFESSQKDNRSCLEKCLGKFCCCCCLGKRRKFDYSTLEYWRCYDNVPNGDKSATNKLISQNPRVSGLQENYCEPHNNPLLDRSHNMAWNDENRNDFIGKTIGRKSKRGENRCETQVSSVLIIPASLPTEIPTNSDQISFDKSLAANIVINSKICVDCLNVYEGNICHKCDLEKISAQHNSLINYVDSNTSSDTSLSSEISTNSFQINEDRLPDNSKVAERRDISASKCIICKNYLNESEAYELLCKHTFCETCIEKQINLETLAHTNIMACCDRPFEQDEIKYCLPDHEYEQFIASYKQQCFDKNCSGYHLWEERVEESSITFTCNKCKLENCSKCVTIHVNLTCEQYDKIRNSVDKETVEVFLTWIREGIAMPCPNCQALIEKDEGCDWVQCPFCNIEICWATRGPRWGAEGKGDTSGGCGCDFKVKKCVENCNYCH